MDNPQKKKSFIAIDSDSDIEPEPNSNSSESAPNGEIYKLIKKNKSIFLEIIRIGVVSKRPLLVEYIISTIFKAHSFLKKSNLTDIGKFHLVVSSNMRTIFEPLIPFMPDHPYGFLSNMPMPEDLILISNSLQMQNVISGMRTQTDDFINYDPFLSDQGDLLELPKTRIYNTPNQRPNFELFRHYHLDAYSTMQNNDPYNYTESYYSLWATITAIFDFFRHNFQDRNKNVGDIPIENNNPNTHSLFNVYNLIGNNLPGGISGDVGAAITNLAYKFNIIKFDNVMTIFKCAFHFAFKPSVHPWYENDVNPRYDKNIISVTKRNNDQLEPTYIYNLYGSSFNLEFTSDVLENSQSLIIKNSIRETVNSCYAIFKTAIFNLSITMTCSEYFIKALDLNKLFFKMVSQDDNKIKFDDLFKETDVSSFSKIFYNKYFRSIRDYGILNSCNSSELHNINDKLDIILKDIGSGDYYTAVYNGFKDNLFRNDIKIVQPVRGDDIYNLYTTNIFDFRFYIKQLDEGNQFSNYSNKFKTKDDNNCAIVYIRNYERFSLSNYSYYTKFNTDYSNFLAYLPFVHEYAENSMKNKSFKQMAKDKSGESIKRLMKYIGSEDNDKTTNNYDLLKKIANKNSKPTKDNIYNGSNIKQNNDLTSGIRFAKDDSSIEISNYKLASNYDISKYIRNDDINNTTNTSGSKKRKSPEQTQRNVIEIPEDEEEESLMSKSKKQKFTQCKICSKMTKLMDPRYKIALCGKKCQFTFYSNLEQD